MYSDCSLEGNTDSNVISIKHFKDSKTIKMVELPNNKLKISVKAPYIDTNIICKSLTRMLLMSLPYSEAKEKLHLFNWLDNKNDFSPSFYKEFIPGSGLNKTKLIVYRVIPELITLGDYLVIFQYAYFRVYFQVPSKSMTIPSKIIPSFVNNVEETKYSSRNEGYYWESYEINYKFKSNFS